MSDKRDDTDIPLFEKVGEIIMMIVMLVMFGAAALLLSGMPA